MLENSLAEANVALAQLRATQSVPVQVSKDLVPASRVRDAHRRAARAMIISGSVVVALGLAGGVALPIGLSQASSYGDKIDKAPVGTTQLQVLSWKNSKYHAESIAMFGGLSLLAIIPGAVVMGMGFGQLRNSKREISWNVSPNHVSATMRF